MPLSPEELEALTTAVATGVKAAVVPLIEKQGAAPKQEPPAPAKVYSRAELDKAVQDGTITAAQANDILDTQHTRQAAEIARQAATEQFASLSRTDLVKRDMGEYEKLFPDVLVDGSKDRKRVEKQFEYLVSIGQPDNEATELVALQMVYGPLEAARAARSARNARGESHEEIGGGTPNGNTGDADGPKTRLTARERAYYEKQIQQGLYKDWAAVDAEMKFANDRIRKNAAARAA